MTQIQTFENSSFKVQCVCVSGEPWFKGKEVATILAIRVNVDDDDKKKMEELGKLSDSSLDANAKRSMYINE